MKGKRMMILVWVSLVPAIALVAQQIPPDELQWGAGPYSPEIAGTSAIRVQSDLVEVPVIVRDDHGNAVGNLKKDNFLLFDNGKPQTISSFSVLAGPENSLDVGAKSASDLPEPRYVALYFDDLNTGSAKNMTFARDGAIKFVRRGFDPGVRVGVFTSSGMLTLEFTDDVQAVLEVLSKLRPFERMPDQAPGACPQLGPVQAWVVKLDTGGLTDEFKSAVGAAKACGCADDAGTCARRAAELLVGNAERYAVDTFNSITSVIHHLGQMPGRRVLVLASTGFLSLSLGREQQKVIEAALRAGVTINSLSTAGVGGGMGRLATPLGGLAEGTGGQYFHDNNDIGAGFHSLSASPSVSYILGFSPTNLKIDGTEHTLKVKLADSAHLSVKARPGYLAPSSDVPPSSERLRKLEECVMAADSPTEVPIEFAAVPETLPSGEPSLKVRVHVDIRKLPFQTLNDRHTERLIFITALFDTKNQFLTGVRGVMDLRLKDPTLKQLSTQGLDAKLSINAPIGSYRVRQVVQESAGGRIAAVTRMVVIR
jgi:VWFA-related protein